MRASDAVVFDRLSFRYPGGGRNVVSGIDLNVRAGEFLLVTGPSGSGKTTLARCVNGLVPHFHEGEMSGSVRVEGLDTRELDVGQIGAMVGSVFQDPRSQFFMTDTTGEVAFGCANAGLAREEAWQRVDAAFERLEIGHLRDRSVFELSSGEMQQVAVASCYAMEPSVYVFDEPSANLDMEAIRRLARIMRELKRMGRTVVVLEHRLFYLAGLFDRMIVVEGGSIRREYSSDEAAGLESGQLGRMGLRNLRLADARPGDGAGDDGLSPVGATVFEVSGLSFSYGRRRRRPGAAGERQRGGALGPVSLSARGGEVVGIVGRNGAGKTTLSRLCCGLEGEDRGAVALNGRALGRKERFGAIRLIMQDSDYQLFSDSVLGEVSIGPGMRDPAKAEAVLARLGLWDMRDAHPAALSRGQKQRLTIACAIIDDSAVYFFDEPTSGLDKANMEAVAGLLRLLAREGKVVFVISHDFEFLLAACTRIVHLASGRVTADFPLCEGSCARLLGLLGEGGSAWNAAAGD